MQVSTVTLDGCAQRHVSASIEDRCSVVAQQSIDEYDVARSGFVDAQVNAFTNHTYAGSVNKQLVTGSSFDNLRITSNYFYVRLESCRRHGPGDHAQCFDWQAFLDNDGT